MMIHAKIQNPASKSMALCVDVTFCRFNYIHCARTANTPSKHIYSQFWDAYHDEMWSSAQRWHCDVKKASICAHGTWQVWENGTTFGIVFGKRKNNVWFMVLRLRHVGMWCKGWEWVMEREREYAVFGKVLARNGFSGAAHRINNKIIQWHILKLSSTRRPCCQFTIKCAFNLLKSNENVLFAFANSQQPILIIRLGTSHRVTQNADMSCAFFVNKLYSYSNRMTPPLFQS